MRGHKVILQTRHLILTGALLALGLILGGMAHSLWYRAWLVQEARDRNVLAASSFARAVADWVRDDNPETMSRVADLMLLGSYLWVCVVSEDETLIDRATETFEDVPRTSVSLAAPEEVQSRLDRSHGIWYFDTVAAIPYNPPRGGANHVHVAADVSFLRGQLAIRNLWVFAFVVATWVALVGLLAGGGFTLMRRGRLTLAAWEAREDEGGEPTEIIRRGGLTVNTITMEVHVLENPVNLTPKQYALLTLLANDEGKVFADTEIISEIWPDSPLADANDIRQCIYRLRRRLQKALEGADKMIVTVKGFGYRFDSGAIDSEGTER